MGLTGRFAARFSDRELCRSKSAAGTARAPARARGLAVQPAACRRRRPALRATRAGRRQRCGGPPALEHLSTLRLVQGARRRTPWPAPPAVGDVMLKLERRGRGLITRGDHEGPTRLCASSMSDRCWLRRTPSGSLLAASHPLRLQAGAASRLRPHQRPATAVFDASRRHGTAGRPAHRRRTPSRARRPSTASC